MESTQRKELTPASTNSYSICSHFVATIQFHHVKPHYIKAYNQIGSSMIEMLVSLLILAIGLLGILSLQISALNSVQRTMFISEAQLLATDMADHILSHGVSGKGATDGSFANNTDDDGYATADCSTGCSETEQIRYIHTEWQNALHTRLPGGAGKVTWDSAHLTYTITVSWHQHEDGIVNSNCGSSANTDLTCFIIQVKL